MTLTDYPNHRDNELFRDYQQYILLERNLSPNTLQSYAHDVSLLIDYAQGRALDVQDLTYEELQGFVATLYDMGISKRSIMRIISGVKSFYRYLELEEIRTENPTTLLDAPRVGLHLPEVLTLEEVDRIIDAIDTSAPLGVRNLAIVELLYSCGLRVSELCDLTFSQVYLEEGYVRPIGKGSKERLVPMSPASIQNIYSYLPIRQTIDAKPRYAHHLFLSRNRRALTRQMVFVIIKQLAQSAGIDKVISPHTFRHSFATHLLEGGAHLQAIRDMLGHADIATTEIYTHIDRSTLRREILEHHPRNQKRSSETER